MRLALRAGAGGEGREACEEEEGTRLLLSLVKSVGRRRVYHVSNWMTADWLRFFAGWCQPASQQEMFREPAIVGAGMLQEGKRKSATAMLRCRVFFLIIKLSAQAEALAGRRSSLALMEYVPGVVSCSRLAA